MNNERMYELASSKLSQALTSFKDVNDLYEAERNMERLCKSGYIHTLQNDFEFLKSFLDSNPDKEWVRDFVTWEMNWDLPDPTGELQIRWLRDALVRMQEVLKKYDIQNA